MKSCISGNRISEGSLYPCSMYFVINFNLFCFAVSDPPYGIREPAAKVGSNKAEVEAIPEEYQGMSVKIQKFIKRKFPELSNNCLWCSRLEHLFSFCLTVVSSSYNHATEITTFYSYAIFIIPTKFFLDFLPEIFCTFLRASWKLLELPYLWYCLLSQQEDQIVSRKPQGGYKKFQGRNPEIISLVYQEKISFHKDIIKSTDL